MAVAATKPFDPEATCPKCGHDDVRLRFSSGLSPWTGGCSSECPSAWSGEHLDRRCKRCGYKWTERVAAERDADVAPDTGDQGKEVHQCSNCFDPEMEPIDSRDGERGRYRRSSMRRLLMLRRLANWLLSERQPCAVCRRSWPGTVDKFGQHVCSGFGRLTCCGRQVETASGADTAGHQCGGS